MAQKTPWHIFFKCFRNQATPEELAEINDWLEDDTENIKVLEEVYNVFSLSAVLPPPLTPDTQKAWQKVDQKISIKKTKTMSLTGRFRYVAAIAAVLVLGLMAVAIIHSYIRNLQISGQFTEIVTQPGQKTSVILPDGSTVWLNSSSSLKYPANFNIDEREVAMTGEAFFEVKKNQSKTFRVKSGDLHVEVHGTSFDVKNYPDEDAQTVTVAEGVVGLVSNSREISRLTKGEQAIYNKISGKVTVTPEDPGLVAAWKNNELIFRDTPIKEVIKSLESWYGVKITIDNKMVGEHNYTFKVKTESFREVLDMMKLMTPFSYTINGKDIEIKNNN
jgi:ferric-dicitrate binding protein FerR (iron transport regulator)